MKKNIIILLMIIFSMHLYGQYKKAFAVNGIRREAVFYMPEAIMEKSPVIFCYHGHGGSLKSIIRQMKFSELWKEVIVVYPQGLKTKLKGYDKWGLQTGWQINIGDEDDRDILFFDEILDYLKEEYSINEKQIFVTGFSNGAIFSYVLLAARANTISAIAPIAGFLSSESDSERIIGKPIFHVLGRKDKIVKYAWQAEMIKRICKINNCVNEEIQSNKSVTKYSSNKNYSFYVYEEDVGHVIPKQSIGLITEFFKSLIE